MFSILKEDQASPEICIIPTYIKGGVFTLRKRWIWAISAFAAVVVAFGFFYIPAGAASNYQIEVNKTTNELFLYKNGEVIKKYPVATGRTPELTPEGTFPIVVKINKPGWRDIPGGDPRNPLGEKWMGLSVKGDKGRTYGIHGTNKPESIGTHASSGCIRMAKDNLIELYNIVPEGTPVWIHSGKSTGKWEGDPSFSVQPSSGKVKVVKDLASVMTGPSLGAFEIQKAKKDTIFEVTGVIKDWYEIKLPNGKYAFIHSSNVTKVSNVKDPVQQDQIKPASGQIMISVDLANIRSNPSLDAPIFQRVKYGTKITLTGIGNEWYRVKLSNGYTAYVHKSVAKVVSSK